MKYLQSDVMRYNLLPLTFNASIATLLARGLPPYVDPCCKEWRRIAYTVTNTYELMSVSDKQAGV